VQFLVIALHHQFPFGEKKKLAANRALHFLQTCWINTYKYSATISHLRSGDRGVNYTVGDGPSAFTGIPFALGLAAMGTIMTLPAMNRYIKDDGLIDYNTEI
jgi:hypothetical protein